MDNIYLECWQYKKNMKMSNAPFRNYSELSTEIDENDIYSVKPVKVVLLI